MFNMQKHIAAKRRIFCLVIDQSIPAESNRRHLRFSLETETFIIHGAIKNVEVNPRSLVCGCEYAAIRWQMICKNSGGISYLHKKTRPSYA
jgi:hypothetical protein